MNLREDRETNATVERAKKLFSDGGQMPGMASDECQSPLTDDQEEDSYPEWSEGSDEPFFASNLIYYPELPQPYAVGPYQSYRNWKIFNDSFESMQQQWRQTRTRPEYPEYGKQQPVNADTEVWQQLGQNVCLWTQQPNGRPLVPISSLAQMNGVELACVLLATHLIKQRGALNENCILTHFNSNELRSHLVLNEEVRDVLHRCEQRERCLQTFVPHLNAPLAHRLPRPPARWLPGHDQNSTQQPKPKTKPKQKQQRMQNEQTKRTEDSISDSFINPSLRVIEEWDPETACYVYKLQSLY